MERGTVTHGFRADGLTPNERPSTLPLPLATMLLGVAAAAVGPHEVFGVQNADILILGTAIAFFGAAIFWRHGGVHITAAGVAGLTSAVLCGYGSLYWYLLDPAEAVMSRPGLWANYLTLTTMYTLWWRSPLPRMRPCIATQATAHPALVVAVGTALLGAFVPPFSGSSQTVVFGGVALFLLLVLAQRPGRSGWLVAAALGFLALGFYVRFGFGGFGRNVLVQLLVVAAILASAIVGRWVKAATLVAVVPGLAALSAMRESFSKEELGTELDGMGSIVGPVTTLDELLAARTNGEVGYGWGESFVGTLSLPIPREIWEGKPVGFGTRLTEILRPQLLDAGHSMAATAPGQWIYEFGWLGLVPMVVVVGWWVRWLDDSYARATRMPISGPLGVLRCLALLLATTGLISYMWGDTFTYAGRFLFQIGLPALLLLLWAFIAPRPRPARRPAVEPSARCAVPQAGPRLRCAP